MGHAGGSAQLGAWIRAARRKLGGSTSKLYGAGRGPNLNLKP